MVLQAYEVTVTYGYGSGCCNECESEINIRYCHRDLINTCDGCLRASFDANKKGCGKCVYASNCSIVHEYSDIMD